MKSAIPLWPNTLKHALVGKGQVIMRDMPSGSKGLLSYFTRHPTLANLLLLILLIAGLMAVPNMRAQFFPDVIIDNVSVSVTWDGAGAEDVDRAIVQVLEPALLLVEGAQSAQTTSREGSARMVLEFESGWDMARAAADVQAAIDAGEALPEGADTPKVARGVWRDRVTDLVITGPVGVDQLARFADELTLRLFARGVTRTTIRGIAAPQTVVEVPSAQLIAHGISLHEVAAAIAAEAQADPLGDVGGGAARVRGGIAKRDVEAISGIVLRSRPDGSRLTIGDVARIETLGTDRERAYFKGSNPALSIRVDRSDQGDAIAIQALVEQVAGEFAATLPDGVSVDLIRTRAEAITGRLNILLDNALTGLGLVVLLLFLFLNARTAFWVAAGIPSALLAAIALMYLAGLTINMISLFALIITLGIVVDDAIVVGEHADARFRSGLGPYEAAETAAQRMALPVFCATLTTVIAFFGLVAVGGRFGDLIADIPFTVIVVLLASLVECFLILPHHMAGALRHAGVRHWYDLPSRLVNRGFEALRDGLFTRLTRLVIAARYAVLAGVVALLASQIALLIRGDVQWRFFNAPERASVTGNFAMAQGANREDTLAQMKLFQEAIEDLGLEYQERYGRNPLTYVIAEIGGNAGRGLAGVETRGADLLGGVSIELIEADLRPYSSFAFVGELQKRVPRHPMVELLSFRSWRSGPGGDALDVQFYGASAAVLKQASEDLKAALERYAEVSAVEDDLTYDKDELILELTAQGQALGFDIDGLGANLRARLGGIEAVRYPVGPRSATIRVSVPEGELTADFLERMQMRSPSGAYLPLADIVSVTRNAGFSTVRRENGIRLISVTGDISEDNPARASEIMSALEKEILPGIASRRQVEYRLSGLSEQEDSFLADARSGLILALAGIYLVLAWAFASWTRPLVVMTIIPFGLIGTIFGHWLWEVPLSMFTVVGLLGMTGIIINDSIVLVSRIDELARNRGLVLAIVDGASDRLRAVFLTTATTVLGLAPLLYERSSDAQFLKPTVITLVYGLGFGMGLVLLVVPALIAVQDDLARLIRAVPRALRRRAGGLRFSVGIGASAMLVWLWLTLGHVSMHKALPATLTHRAWADLDPMSAALGLFIGGMGVLCLGLYVLSGTAITISRRRNRADQAQKARPAR